MYRIGIFGAENSHAMAFSQMFNGDDPAFPDMQVVAIGGDEPEAAQKIHDECGVAQIAQRPEDMLGHIDAAMVTSRNGALHLGYARTFIEAGLPTFVDKPIANDAREAVALIELAKKKGVPLVGGSSVKLLPAVQALKKQREELGAQGGYVFAPLNMHNPYGGFYFYSAHLVETMLEIFGMDPVSVEAYRAGDHITAVVRYPSFDVPVQFLNGLYCYGATLQTAKGAFTREITLDDCYRLETLEYANMLRTGEMAYPYEDMVQSVFVLNAVEKAFTLTGSFRIGGVR